MSSGLEEVVTVCLSNVCLVPGPSWVPSASRVPWTELLMLTHDALPHSAQARSSRPTSSLQLFLLRYFVTMAKLRNTNFTFVIYLFSVFMYLYACMYMYVHLCM